MHICLSSPGPFAFADSCVRETWASILPAAVVVIICISAVPISLPKRVHNVLGLNVFKTYLTLHEAEALEAEGEGDGEVEIAVDSKPPLWRTLVLSTVALLETLAWIALGSYVLVTSQRHGTSLEPITILPFILAFSWLYATLVPILRPAATPPYGLFALYIVQLAMGVLLLGGVLYQQQTSSTPLPDRSIMLALVGNLVAVLVGLGVITNIPMAVPSRRVKKEDIVSLSLSTFSQHD